MEYYNRNVRKSSYQSSNVGIVDDTFSPPEKRAANQRTADFGHTCDQTCCRSNTSSKISNRKCESRLVALVVGLGCINSRMS